MAQPEDGSGGSRIRSRKAVAVLLVGITILLAGCTVAYEADVTSDGEIAELTIEMEMDEFIYQAAADQAEEEGFDSVGEFIFQDEGNFTEEEWDSIDIDDDGESTVSLTARGGTADAVEDVEITVDEEAGEVTYVDTDGLDADEDEGLDEDEIEITYTVNMPGEIIETNGETDGAATVTWTDEEHGGLDELRVTSEQTGADDGFGPGFGVLGILTALLVVAGLALARRY